MLDSIRQYVVEDKLEILLPDIIPEESMELLNEQELKYESFSIFKSNK